MKSRNENKKVTNEMKGTNQKGMRGNEIKPHNEDLSISNEKMSKKKHEGLQLEQKMPST